jgi:imidazolonepropionase-like amidohydrolase
MSLFRPADDRSARYRVGETQRTEANSQEPVAMSMAMHVHKNGTNLIRISFSFLALLPIALTAQVASDRQQFIRVDAPVIALTHVRVIDGTGAAPLEDQTVVIIDGKIQSVSAATGAAIPAGATTLDFSGHTLLPGLVGMHDHMFFPMGGSPPIYSNMSGSFPRLYLALGVTTIRTTGSVAPFTDLEIKRLIDNGRILGPKMHITAPYLEGRGAYTPVMHELSGPDDARRMVNFWADEGATSFKAYMNITRAELRAAVEEAHKRGLKVTGHLCSIGFREAADIGIDDLEHSLFVDAEFVPDKKPDVCPTGAAVNNSLRSLDISGAEVQETIRQLVAHHVAVTSTLPVFESSGAPIAASGVGAASALLNPRMLAVMNSDARARYLAARARVAGEGNLAIIRKAMEFDRAFVRAGGLLLAGLDPTGNGGVVAGFGDLREVELLVESGFSPVEAIRIATLNGAIFLGEDAHIGSIAPGKQADMFLVKGNPAANISDIENVVVVFKDGVGYDSERLIQSVQGLVGIR